MGCGSSKQEAVVEDEQSQQTNNAGGNAMSTKPKAYADRGQPTNLSSINTTKKGTNSAQSKARMDARMDARKNAGRKKPKKATMRLKVDKVGNKPADEEEGLEAFLRDTASIDNDLNKFGRTAALQKKKDHDDEDLRQEALAQQQYLQATYFNNKPSPRLKTPLHVPEPEPEPEVQVEKFLPVQQLQFDNSKFRKGPSAGSPVAASLTVAASPAAASRAAASPIRSGPTGFIDDEPEPMMADVDLDGYLDSDDENDMDNIMNDF